MTAKTKDGKEVFKDSKIYMTQATNSRGDSQMYGAHFKMGYIRDTSLQPGKTKVETFEINFPYEEVEKEKDKPKVRDYKAKELDIDVVLRYQLDPAPGKDGEDSWVLHKTSKTVKVQ